MNQSRISYNVNGAGLPLPEVLEKHITAINPRWLLIMDNIGLARDYHRKFPNTHIIARNWGLTGGDENVYARLSPEAWLDARKGEAEGGIWLYTANEAGINPSWDIALMKLILSRNLDVKLIIGNPSVGTPAIPSWKSEDKREWFELLDQHRDKFVLGLHEYFCGIAPSGFVGGYPDGSWVDGRKNIHPNYEDRNNWPVDASTVGMLWHCGRVSAVNDAAEFFGCKPPRVVITEHGADDLADMHPWLAYFRVSGGRANHRAWKTLLYIWEKVFPNRVAEQAYFDNISYLDSAVYSKFPNVEGQLLYTWTSNLKDWGDFDLSTAEIFHRLLEEYVSEEPMPNTTTPSYPPPVFVAGSEYTLQVSDNAGTNVRTSPIVSIDNKVVTIPNHTVIKVMEVKAVNIDYWARIECALGNGWISLRGNLVSWTPVPVVVDDPPPVVVTPVTLPGSTDAETVARMITRYQQLVTDHLEAAKAHKAAYEDELLLSQDYLSLLQVWQSWEDTAQTATKAA